VLPVRRSSEEGRPRQTRTPGTTNMILPGGTRSRLPSVPWNGQLSVRVERRSAKVKGPGLG
jgi:hypothetical protein